MSDRVFDLLRDKRSFSLTDTGAVEGDFGSLAPFKYVVLVTFRGDGTPVPSPVWFAIGSGDSLFVKTANHSGKVKRCGHDNRALVAPANCRGKPLGPAVRATARLLSREEWAHAEETLAAAYGTGRRIAERILGGDPDLAAYIELSPGRAHAC